MTGGSFSRTVAGNQAYFAMQVFFVLGHHSTLLPKYEEHCVVAAKDTKKPLAQFSDMALSHTFTLGCPQICVERFYWQVLNVSGFIVVFILGNPIKDQEAVPTVTYEKLKTQTKRTAFYLSRRPSFRWRSPIRVKSRQATRPLTSDIRLTRWWQTT